MNNAAANSVVGMIFLSPPSPVYNRLECPIHIKTSSSPCATLTIAEYGASRGGLLSRYVERRRDGVLQLQNAVPMIIRLF